MPTLRNNDTGDYTRPDSEPYRQDVFCRHGGILFDPERIKWISEEVLSIHLHSECFITHIDGYRNATFFKPFLKASSAFQSLLSRAKNARNIHKTKLRTSNCNVNQCEVSSPTQNSRLSRTIFTIWSHPTFATLGSSTYTEKDRPHQL